MPGIPSKSGKRPLKGGKAKSRKAKGLLEKQSGGATGNRVRKVKRVQRWSGFVYRVLQQVHEDLGITARGMKIMNSFAEDMFERIYNEVIAISKLSKTKTLTAREVQTSARLLLPGELAKHAMSEGTKAVAKYTASVQQSKEGTHKD
eukprot:PhM_4_TR16215/c0_g1_i1/m.94577/K11252/H2B; histone H2B